MLTDDMKRVVREQRLGFVATVCADGTPNLSPKGTTSVWDDEHLVFADLASPSTVENLRRNPAIEVNVVDVLVRKGYRFKGTASVHSGDVEFERGLAFYAGRIDRAAERIRHIVLVRVESAEELISPAYDDAASEDEVRATWQRHWQALWNGDQATAAHD